MKPMVQYCPKCGAMQGAWEVCGRCGAKLGASDAPAEAIPSVRRLIVTLSLYILAVVGGLVLVGALCAALLTLFAR